MRCIVATLGRPGLHRLYRIEDNLSAKEFTIVREELDGTATDVYSFSYQGKPKDLVFGTVEDILVQIVKETPNEIVGTH